MIIIGEIYESYIRKTQNIDIHTCILNGRAGVQITDDIICAHNWPSSTKLSDYPDPVVTFSQKIFNLVANTKKYSQSCSDFLCKFKFSATILLEVVLTL